MMHSSRAKWYILYMVSTFVYAISNLDDCVTIVNTTFIIGHASTARPTVCEWLGVPYAAAPIGDLRFATPVKLPLTKTIDADNYVRSSLNPQKP